LSDLILIIMAICHLMEYCMQPVVSRKASPRLHRQSALPELHECPQTLTARPGGRNGKSPIRPWWRNRPRDFSGGNERWQGSWTELGQARLRFVGLWLESWPSVQT
jgi:hypothetical protein